MEAISLNQYIDHTCLKPFATKAELATLCAEAKQYRFATVCVNPCNVKLAAKELAGSAAHAAAGAFCALPGRGVWYTGHVRVL